MEGLEYKEKKNDTTSVYIVNSEAQLELTQSHQLRCLILNHYKDVRQLKKEKTRTTEIKSSKMQSPLN